MTDPKPLPFVELADIADPGDTFACRCLSARLTAASCLLRQRTHGQRRPINASGRVDERGREHGAFRLGYMGRCGDCADGRAVAGRLRDVAALLEAARVGVCSEVGT